MSIIISILVSVFLTWIIAHIYYKSSKKDQDDLYKKLNSETRDIILKVQKDSLSVKELNEILEEKVFDKESSEIFPYKVCPKCGSENLIRSFEYIVDTDIGNNGEPFHTASKCPTIECFDCGWKKSTMDN
ncbi:MAG: hypothetical protein KAW87_05690 [Candidatus Cloacimonetes bacterium]|nr:hypothetical protein [Candidatus Cloacimonadota bacterium]